MHSISLVIHLIYSLQQLPLQNSVSQAPIGVVVAQRDTEPIRLAERASLLKLLGHDVVYRCIVSMAVRVNVTKTKTSSCMFVPACEFHNLMNKQGVQRVHDKAADESR